MADKLLRDPRFPVDHQRNDPSLPAIKGVSQKGYKREPKPEPTSDA